MSGKATWSGKLLSASGNARYPNARPAAVPRNNSGVESALTSTSAVPGSSFCAAAIATSDRSSPATSGSSATLDSDGTSTRPVTRMPGAPPLGAMARNGAPGSAGTATWS